MKKVSLFIFTLLFTAILPFSSAFAEKAVSQLNTKVEALAGSIEDDGVQAVQGSISVPLGSQFGVQLDLLGGNYDSETISGAGGHFFWRNPDFGLVGITASHNSLDDIDFNRYGAEAEYYLKDFTFSVYGGLQDSDDISDTGYSGLKLSYYFTDNLLIQLGGETLSDQNNSNMKIEWQPDFVPSGLSCFASGMMGENDQDAYYAGIRFYWGGSDTLKERHRRDDPSNVLLQNIVNGFSAVNADIENLSSNNSEDSNDNESGSLGLD